MMGRLRYRRIRTLRCAAALAACPALAIGSQALAQQQSTRSAQPAIPPTVTAVLAQHGAPRLDGRLDDPVWQSAAPIAEFIQVEPEDGAAPTERTEVQVAYDGAALYVGARMYSSDPRGVTGRLGRRDSYTSSDLFTVVIDSYHDHRTSFRFRVNPKGVRSDDITANDDEEGDESWDPVWDVATRIDSLGWVAEIRIPFSQLRFSAADEQVWGINFTRLIFAKNEFVRWSWVPNTEQGFAS
ncbi:MAG: carbohydrate binding family 9 domain-containing protein, partial [Gemmatimonadales bacterium]|nr:carbohydrate binding family 9 domain-containing protein [Gemmatimonadales bacterium]